MKVGISEVRRRLPELVSKVSRNDVTVQITVHGEVVAELRRALPETEPGAAARNLAAIMRRLPKQRGAKRRVSSRTRESLYGRR
jgi:antitoxin (DNA-binding transcriptional repressor) of toxin-antitoxin stability system